MPTTHPLPDGPSIALAGLQAAADRLDTARAAYRTDGTAYAVAAALTEAIMWVAALDGYARKIVKFSGYDDSPQTSEQGRRAIGGLVITRNAHLHQLISKGEDGTRLVKLGEIGDPPDGPERHLPSLSQAHVRLFKRDLVWKSTPPPPDPAHPETHGRDEMYLDTVAQRPLLDPIRDAHSWLSALPWP